MFMGGSIYHVGKCNAGIVGQAKCWHRGVSIMLASWGGGGQVQAYIVWASIMLASWGKA